MFILPYNTGRCGRDGRQCESVMIAYPLSTVRADDEMKKLINGILKGDINCIRKHCLQARSYT